MSQNLVEKIAQKFAADVPAGHLIQSGDYLTLQPAHILTHDNTAPVMQKFNTIGANKIANPRQPVFALDHNIQDTSEKNLEKYRSIEAFAKKMGVDFYPAGRGIGHQIMLEEGYAFPGEMAVASDSHANMYGGLGCLGTPVVRTDAAGIWASGRTWWQVPPVAKCILTGQLPKGVTGKDVILTLCGLFCHDEVLNHAVEFAGNGILGLSIDDRLTIANMTTEWGALAGLFPIDTATIDWLRSRPRIGRERIEKLEKNIPHADPEAHYAKTLTLDLSTVQPLVAGPDQVKITSPVWELEKRDIKINKAYLLSCVNARTDDFAAAAAVIRGKKIAEGVKFYISAASSEVQAESETRGDWQALVEAGAMPLPPGCGACIGLGAGLLENGEIGISATNRNFKGRMGSREAKAYLASPAVVAASAVQGKIAGLGSYPAGKPVYSLKEGQARASRPATPELIKGFPKEIEGELIFCPRDNINTDGIYPGKYTYIDDFPPEKMAEVVMENYDPAFAKIVREGDILVGGYNFGTGSSREQAATALKYRGIQMVIAGSASQTYKRNALNNGFIILEVPKLVENLKVGLSDKVLSTRTEWIAFVDFKKSIITTMGKAYPFTPLGKVAQELIVSGGLENWIQRSYNVEV